MDNNVWLTLSYAKYDSDIGKSYELEDDDVDYCVEHIKVPVMVYMSLLQGGERAISSFIKGTLLRRGEDLYYRNEPTMRLANLKRIVDEIPKGKNCMSDKIRVSRSNPRQLETHFYRKSIGWNKTIRDHIYQPADYWESPIEQYQYDADIVEIREYDTGFYTVLLSNGDEKDIYTCD